MNTMKMNKIITYIFIGILITAMCGIHINYFYSKKMKKLSGKAKRLESYDLSILNKGNIETITKKIEPIDYIKRYPLEKATAADEKHSGLQMLKDKFLNLNEKASNNFRNVDGKLKIYFPFRTDIVALNRAITGSRKSFLNLDSLVTLQDDYYAFVMTTKCNFEEEGKRTVAFAKSLEANGIKFCSVTYPSKFSKFKNDCPPGIVDYSNENADTFLNVLKNNNVNCLDLRENAARTFDSHLKMFFRTDHHWKPETAFWATGEMLKFFNENLGFKFDCSLLNKDNFKFTTFKNFFLGSHGKKVTLALAKPDDITIIEPNFPTEYEVGNFEKSEIKKGNYHDVVISIDELFYNDIYSGDAYNSYGSPSFINNLSPLAKHKIVIIHDSFSIPVIPFLSVAAKEITHLDIRRQNNYSVEKYLLELKPDLVILAYGTDRYNIDRDPDHMQRMFVFK